MEPLRIRGLTLHQPWAFLVSHGGKWIENRSWPAPSSACPGYVAIHAGKTADEETWRDLANAAREKLKANAMTTAMWQTICQGAETRGAIMAVARLDRCVAPGSDDPALKSVWYSGEGYAWVLSEVKRFVEPVPAKGMQGLWPLPPDVLAAVRAAWRNGTWTERTESR